MVVRRFVDLAGGFEEVGGCSMDAILYLEMVQLRTN